MRENLKKEIRDIFNLGVVRESKITICIAYCDCAEGEWKNCMSVNYRKLNRAAVADSEAVTSEEDLF